MKKIFSSLLIVSLFSGTSAFAAFDPMRDPTVQNAPQKVTEQKTSPLAVSQQPSRRLTYGFRSRTRASYSNKTQTEDITTSFTSDQGFSFTLPKSFEVVSDDLTQDAGAYVLSDGNTTIRVEPSDKTCPMALGQLRLCLEEILQGLHAQKSETYKNLKRQDKREFSLDQEEASKQTINIALWSLSQSGNQKIGALVFIEKNSKKVWTISVEGSSNDDFFKQPRYLLILAQSLSQKDPENKFGSYATNLTQQGSSSLASRQGIRTRASSRVSMKKDEILEMITTHKSSDESFEITLPNGYSLVTDTLGEEAGKIEWMKENQSISVMPLDQTCPIKREGALYRACVESWAEMMKKDFQEEIPGLNILTEENIGLNLDNTKYKDDFARITKWFDRSLRYAQIVLVHPTTNQVWLARIKGTDTRNEILTDPQLLEKTLNSLRLK